MNGITSVGGSCKLDAKARTLTIVLPLKSPMSASSTGKTLIAAGTSGAVEAGVDVNGKPLMLNVNAYIYATDKVTKKTATAGTTAPATDEEVG